MFYPLQQPNRRCSHTMRLQSQNKSPFNIQLNGNILCVFCVNWFLSSSVVIEASGATTGGQRAYFVHYLAYTCAQYMHSLCHFSSSHTHIFDPNIYKVKVFFFSIHPEKSRHTYWHWYAVCCVLAMCTVVTGEQQPKPAPKTNPIFKLNCNRFYC